MGVKQMRTLLKIIRAEVVQKETILKYDVDYFLNEFNDIPDELKSECAGWIDTLVKNYKQNIQCVVVKKDQLDNRAIQCVNVSQTVNESTRKIINNSKVVEKEKSLVEEVNTCPSCKCPAKKGFIEELNKKGEKKVYRATVECKLCYQSYHQKQQCAGVNKNCSDANRAVWSCKTCKKKASSKPISHDLCQKCFIKVEEKNYEKHMDPVKCVTCDQLSHKHCMGVKSRGNNKIWQCNQCKPTTLAIIKNKISKIF